MKWALATGSVLGYADYAKPFMSESDAGYDGLSTILPQEQGEKQYALGRVKRTAPPTAARSWNFLPFNRPSLHNTAKTCLEGISPSSRTQSVDLFPLCKVRRARPTMSISVSTVPL